MQNILLKTLFFCILLSSCSSVDVEDLNRGSHVRDEDYEKIANGVTYRVEQQLKKELGLRCVGTGGGMMNNIRRMSMSFQLFREIDLPEARRILVSATSEYLNAINDSKRLRPYLKEYPFTVKNVEIMIWIRKANNRDIDPNKINFMCSNKGILRYDLSDEPGTYLDRELCTETYEEALKIIQAEDAVNSNKAS